MVTLRFLLDTNAISEPFRPRPDAGLMTRMREHEGAIAIAAITWHELLFGWLRLAESARKQAVEYYLYRVVNPAVALLPYDERAAAWHAAERARLTRIGRTPAYPDSQIAAIAATNGLTVVTTNVAAFADFEGVEVVDWRSAQ